tara:strand:- start:90 stop:2222 length:2133 start_codon:yes stop_codon:yes gene_type:complete
MAQFLSTARDNFNSFGGSLASIQQNAQDDANSNAQTSDFYNQTLAQIQAQAGIEGPQALVFGGVEAIRQSTELYQRFQSAVEKAKELPSTLSGIATKTVGKLNARQQQAKDLYDTAKTKLSGTLEDVQAHATSVANQAKGVFNDATLSLKDSANLDELKTNFSNFKSDLTDRLSKANDIIDSNIKQYSDLADQAKSQIGDVQGKLDALKSSATGELTGLAKDQYDALSAKLPDLLGQVDKANAFIASANETRDTYAKQVADQITQQGEKAKAQFADISSKLSPDELQTQLGLPKPAAPPAAPSPPAAPAPPAAPTVEPTVAAPAPPAPAAVVPTVEPTVVPTVEPVADIIPSATEGAGRNIFSRIGDMFRTKTTSTLQTARDAQNQIMEFDPESSGVGRGFITSTNEQIARFVSPPAAAPPAAPPTAAPRAAPPAETELEILPSRVPFADEASSTAARLAAQFPRGGLQPNNISLDITEPVRVLPTIPTVSAPEIPAAATSVLEDLGSVGSKVLGAAGSAAGVFGGVQAAMDASKGQFNANDAANAFFGVEAGKSLGESAIGGIKSVAASLGEQLSGGSAAAGNLINAAQETGSKVITSLSQTASKGAQAAQDVISNTQNLVGGALKTGSETAGAALDLVKGGAADVAESVAEASSAILPVVGEAVGIGLAGYQIYEGFKDLFTHPSEAAPPKIAVPTIANISQGFQSGI